MDPSEVLIKSYNPQSVNAMSTQNLLCMFSYFILHLFPVDDSFIRFLFMHLLYVPIGPASSNFN